MRVIHLGIAEDCQSADPVLRALERSGFTVDDVTVLLACPDEKEVKSPMDGPVQLPVEVHPHLAEGHAVSGSGFVAVTSGTTLSAIGIVAAPAIIVAQRAPTITLNVRTERGSSGVARDLHAMGIPLADAIQIADVVRMHNVLLLVEDRPGRCGDSIIETMLAEGLSKVFIMFVAEQQDEKPPAWPHW